VTAADSAAGLTPAVAWSRRVRRIGGFIQAAFAAFAAFWLARTSLAIGGRAGDVLIAMSGVAVIGVFSCAIKVTAGTAPRPAAGHSDWVLPSIVITIGPLLLWLDHLVHIPRYRPVGWALTAGPVILVATMSGSSLAVTTGIAAGVILLGTATAGFHDLASLRPAGPPGRARPRAKAR